MKIRVFVSFHARRASYPRVRDVLGAIKCTDGLEGEESILCGYYSHTFDSEDTRLPKLRRILESERISWSEREEHVYSDAELRSFPLLQLTVDRKPLEAGGPQYGTTYDLSKACPRCGTGAIQTSPLILPLSGLPKKGLLCAAGDGEILVAEPLMAALEEAGVTGLELRQVRLHGNNEPLPWWQMISTYEMPKMGPKTRRIDRDSALKPCTQCRRDGHCYKGDEPWDIVYSSDDVSASSLPDVVHAWESFGKSGIDKEQPQFSRYGDHLLFVKPKVFDIFRRLKVRHARFTPVRISD